MNKRDTSRLPQPNRDCADDIREWAESQYEATGSTIDELVVRAIEQFCVDGPWTRMFVAEQLHREIAAAVAGTRRWIAFAEGEEYEPPIPIDVPPIRTRHAS